MPRDEGQFALSGPRLRPLQRVRHLHGFAVFVSSKKTDIEVEERILEVDGIENK
jgi:hypothetical protein